MNKYLKQQKTTKLEYACCRAGREYMLKAYGADVYDNVSPKQVWKGLLRDVRALLRGNPQFVGPESLHAAWVRRKRACGLTFKDNSSICGWEYLSTEDKSKWHGFVAVIRGAAQTTSHNTVSQSAQKTDSEVADQDNLFSGPEKVVCIAHRWADSSTPYIELEFDNGTFASYEVEYS